MRFSKLQVLFVAAVATVAIAGFATAAPIVIANPSFESPNMDNYYPWEKQADNWSGYSRVMDYYNPNYKNNQGYRGQDGHNFIITNSSASQSLSTAAVAGMSYDLTVDTTGGYNYNDPASYTITLLAGSTVLGTVSGTNASTTPLLDYNIQPLGSSWNIYKPLSPSSKMNVVVLHVVAPADLPANQPLVIKLASSNGSYSGFDNVRLDAVPEPATMALLGMGGVFGLLRRRS